MLCKLANLDETSLSAINEYESHTGRTLLAYTCKEFDIDDMSSEDMTQLNKLEDKLSVQLVAVK